MTALNLGLLSLRGPFDRNPENDGLYYLQVCRFSFEHFAACWRYRCVD